MQDKLPAMLASASKKTAVRHAVMVVLLCLVAPEIPASSVNREPVSPLPDPPPANRAVVQLGKSLFNDLRLSKDSTVSCASCHDIASGGDDGRPVSVGINGSLGKRNAPSVFNRSLDMAQFWDGRATSLAQQAEHPITSPVEMGSEWETMLERLRADTALAQRFASAFADGITRENVIKALVAYQGQLITTGSAFDHYLQGNRHAISGFAEYGYRVFKQLGCASCHQGRNVGGNMYQRFGVVIPLDTRSIPGAGQDLGRFEVTGDINDKYKFKVPSLRNVTETAPYFHDGSEPTLEGAIRKMIRHQLGRPVEEDNVVAIVEFLKTLTGNVREDLL